MAKNEDFYQLGHQLVKWCRDAALPYWAKNGLDPSGGGYERLFMDGQPDVESLRRVRVQARQAYVYAHAGALGWFGDAQKVSDHFWSYLIKEGFQSAPSKRVRDFEGCAHLLNPDGSLNDGLRDTYAQAFVILAGAWRYIAFGDEISLKIAEDTVHFLDTELKAENGGWLEGLPSSLPRRQNPHMHLFEALMALYDATGNKDFINKAADIFELFQTVFFDRSTGGIIEFFNQDWTRAADGGGPFEPGHLMEWCWLLRQYGERTGEDVDAYADALYAASVRLGFDHGVGLLCDTISLDGSWPSKTYRTWPQTEFIKASIVQGLSGDHNAVLTTASLIETLQGKYLSVSEKGGWADQLDETGTMISNTMPASTFYHIFSACVSVDRLLGRK